MKTSCKINIYKRIAIFSDQTLKYFLKQKLTYLVTSEDGPAINEVPVSEIAWHPPLQNIVDPIFTPSILNCQYPFLVTGTKIFFEEIC